MISQCIRGTSGLSISPTILNSPAINPKRSLVSDSTGTTLTTGAPRLVSIAEFLRRLHLVHLVEATRFKDARRVQGHIIPACFGKLTRRHSDPKLRFSLNSEVEE